MNYMNITPCDVANGVGVRTILWVSGCSLNCPGCHNQCARDRYAGQPFDAKAKEELFDALSKPYVRGITLSGGHPLEAYNLLDIYLLLTDIRTKFPDKDVWLYTGLTLPLSIFSPVDKNDVDGLAHNMVYSILSLCDVVVDGPFIQEQRDIRLQFRGSTNQRLIDVAKTLENKEITLWENN